MLKERFDELAAYNQFVNARLYADAATLPDQARKQDIGLFFKSLHGTLNHLLVTDYIWLRRMTGDGPQPERLDQILYDDFADLQEARQAEDRRICKFVTRLQVADFERVLSYRNSTGKLFEQRLGPALAHLFNHQAHHRGQAHAALTILGVAEPRSFDLLAYQRA